MQTLVLRDFSGTPVLTQDAFVLRETALKVARPIQSVINEQEQIVAVNALRELKAIRSGMETTRKAVKAPVLELGKKIDTIASDFVDEVLKQEGRLQGLINHFQRKQIEAAQAEADRLERERREAEALQAKAAQEQDPDKKAALQAESLDKLMESEVSDAIVVEKPRGLVVRQRVDFRVVDPITFVQAYPQFWRACGDKDKNRENELLRVDRMAVLDELNRENGKGIFHQTHFPEELPLDTAKPQLVRPPGIEIFEETKTHVR